MMMDYIYTYNYNESTSHETQRFTNDASFIDEGDSSVPLPDELTKMFKPLECELCGVIVTSEATAYTHYEGKVHMKNVNAYMKEQYNIYGSMKKAKPEFTPHQCEVCKCDLSSLIQAQQHYSGKVHKKNLRKINYDPQTAIAIQQIHENDDLGPDLLKDLPPPPPPPVLSDFICEICNITTNTEYQLIVHKNGTKHKKKVKKLKESLGACGTDGFGYYLGEMPTENFCQEQLVYSVPEPLVTDYLPLSDEPLHFNNIQNNGNSFNETTMDCNEENSALCIRWFKDKTEALPKRPLEDAWVETFNRKTEETLAHTFPIQTTQASASQINRTSIEQLDVSGQTTYSVEYMTNENWSSLIRTYEASPEIAKLPQFSVAAVLPQLQAPPSPPFTLMTHGLFDSLVNETTTAETATVPSSFDPPRIHFRETQQKSNNESSVEPHTTNSALTENGGKEQEIKEADPTKSSHMDKPPSATQNNTSFEPKQNGANIQSENEDDLPKLLAESPIQPYCEEKRGQFITTNWEIPQETSTDNENNQKKKKTVNFLFGFKKELDKKKIVDTNKNLEEDNVHEVVLNKEKITGIPDNQISQNNDNTVQNKETNGTKYNVITDKIVLNKECDASKEKCSELIKEEINNIHSDKKTEDTKHGNDENLKKNKNKHDSYDYNRSKDSHYKTKGLKKNKDDYDKEDRKYRDDYDKGYKKYRDDYEKDKKYRDDYDKGYKKYKDDYDKEDKKYRDDYDKGYKKYKDDYDNDYKMYKNSYDKEHKKHVDDYDNDYKKHKDSYDKDYKRHKDDYDKEHKKNYKDHGKEYKKHRDDNEKVSKKHKGEYDRHRDSDEDHRHEKKKRKHSSRTEKESHKNHNDRKPSLAQPFVHKPSTKNSILSYLAPPSNVDCKDIAMYRTPSGLYYCTTCDYKSKHSSEFTNHLYSKFHKDNKKKTK